MQSELLAWWAKQMLDLVAPAIGNRRAQAPDACVIAVEDHPAVEPLSIRLGTRRAGQVADLGRFVLDEGGMDAARAMLRKLDGRHAVAVRVPGEVVLERTVALPLAAEAELGNLLRYEIDGITPFPVESLFWTWSVVRRDRERKRLHVRLSFIPKNALAALTAALEGLGVAASWLEAVAPSGAACVIPLGHTAESEQRRQLHLRIGLAGAAVLAVAAVVLPFILQSVRQAGVEERIAALQPDLRLAEALRARIGRDSSAEALIAAEHGRVGDPLAVLSAVTDALPDDTFLTDLTIRNLHLEITGQSKAAARLIGVLAASPVLKDPAFIASVTHAENGSDAFSIRAGVAH
jgi:general secretion pathway protein L